MSSATVDIIPIWEHGTAVEFEISRNLRKTQFWTLKIWAKLSEAKKSNYSENDKIFFHIIPSFWKES